MKLVTVAEVSIVYQAAPTENRVNEDAYHFATDSTESLIAVIDGASQRIKLPILQKLVDKAGLPEETTPPAFVAQHTAKFIKEHPQLSPFDLIVGANQSVRQELASVFNPFTLENIVRVIPEYAAMLRDDPRLLRLLLPACVLTVAKINYADNLLTYAHVGDTALFVFYKDGHVQKITSDQMISHDGRALRFAQNVQMEKQAPHLYDVVHLPEVIEQNMKNAIYHNYVDEQGAVNPSLGVGVIDGLPELASYVEVGELKLENVEGILLCSDGMLLAPLDESQTEEQKRYQTMKDSIIKHGLQTHIEQLRQVEVQDAYCDLYPRFKIHDDVSAIYLRFS